MLQAALFLWVLSSPYLGAQAPPTQPAATPPKVDRSPLPGVGDLMVAPQRLLFTGRQRTDELLLVNTGPRTATYRISFVQIDMKEDGAMVEYTEKRPGKKYADELVRFSPRQVTLEPGATQAIRVALRKPEDLPSGEYRSHLVFRAVPEAADVAAAPKESTTNGLSVQLIPVYGVAVPIIVRHGTTDARISLERAAITQTPSPALSVSLARTGNQSVYMNLRAIFTPEGTSDPVVVAQLNMVAIYDGLPRRQFLLPLNLPSPKGSLHFTCLNPESSAVLAETRLELR